MPEIGASRFRFQEGTTPTMKANLPTTDEILSYLSGASGLNDSVGSAQKSASLAEQERHGIVNALTVDQKQILEESLAIYIGPMAALICEDHLVSDIDVTVAINLLAGEIPTATQAKIFKEEMLNRLIK